MTTYSVKGNTVTCYLIPNYNDFRLKSRKFVGVAKCNPKDNFDIKKGKNLATSRAILALKREESEFLKKKLKQLKILYSETLYSFTYNSERIQELEDDIKSYKF